MNVCAYDGTRYPAGATCPRCGADNPRPAGAPAQQLGLDGARRDVMPASQRLRLFEPAPAQIPGQESLGDLG